MDPSFRPRIQPNNNLNDGSTLVHPHRRRQRLFGQLRRFFFFFLPFFSGADGFLMVDYLQIFDGIYFG